MTYQATYTKEEEFWEAFRQFNTLFDFDGWSSHKANKEHTDEFGQIIKEGETYFSRSHGQGWGQKLKLSWNSMDLLLTLVMFNNQTTQAIASNLLEAQLDRIREAQHRIAVKAGFEKP